MSRIIKILPIVVFGLFLQACVINGVVSTNRTGGSCGRLMVVGVCTTVVADLSPQVIDSGVVSIDGQIIGRLTPGVPLTFNAVSRNQGQCGVTQSRRRGNVGVQMQTCNSGYDSQNMVVQWYKREAIVGITTTSFSIQGGNNRQSPYPIVISSFSPLGGESGYNGQPSGSSGGIRWPMN